MIGDYDPDQPRDETGRWSNGGGGAAKNAVSDLHAKHPMNPDNPNERILTSGDKKVGSFEVTERAGRLRIKSIKADQPGQGVGSLILRRILNAADRHGADVELTAAAMGHQYLDSSQLEQWYGRHGFVPEPGYDPALSYMIRYSPKKARDRRITDAAKVIQFPPTRYGSKQKTDALVRAHIAKNVDLIKSIPQQYFDRIEEDIYQNMVSAQRWEVLADKLIETLDYDYGITQSRADLIARDQTSKMNGAFNEDRQTSVGVTSYMWQTSGDERVRPTHADNDGQIFDWDNPPEETGHPGNDVNCRCVALAQFGELEEAV